MSGKEQAPFRIDKGSDTCGFEGVGTRPLDCPNNPWRHPENHRPRICQQCPGDPDIWQVAKEKLPANYIGLKQIARRGKLLVDREK